MKKKSFLINIFKRVKKINLYFIFFIKKRDVFFLEILVFLQVLKIKLMYIRSLGIVFNLFVRKLVLKCLIWYLEIYMMSRVFGEERSCFL